MEKQNSEVLLECSPYAKKKEYTDTLQQDKKNILKSM